MNRGRAPDSTSPATTERWMLRGRATVAPGGTAAKSAVATPSVEPAARKNVSCAPNRSAASCLRIADAAGGVERVVGGRHGRQVEREARLADKLGQVRSREPAALVTWRVEAVDASLCVPVERLEDRCAVLVGYPVGVSCH